MTYSDGNEGQGDTPFDWERLDRYYAGESSPDEAAEVRRWLSADPRREAFVDVMRRLGSRPPSVPHAAPHAATAWAELSRQIGRSPLQRAAGRAMVPAHPARGPRSITVAVAIAAGLVVCALALRMELRARWSGTSALSAREYHTAAAQRETVLLPDGTRFTLGPASRLRLANTFATGERTVELDGEAFFDVTHDPAHPFRVRTQTAITEDVGTRFLVRSYPDDMAARVMVADGRVVVSPGGDGASERARLDLGARDLATIDRAGRASVTHGVDPQDYLAWVHGDLVFRDATLEEVGQELARRYDVVVRVEDPAIRSRLVTASLQGDSLGPVLRAIAITVDATIERSGRVITFRPRLAGKPHA